MRRDGEVIGVCQCGCGEPITERIYERSDRGASRIGHRAHPRFLFGHADPRPKFLLPASPVWRFVEDYKRLHGVTWQFMADLLSYSGPPAIMALKRQEWIKPQTAERIRTTLAAHADGWVEARLIWALIRRRQEEWGLTVEEVRQRFGPECMWFSRADATRILRELAGPRPATAMEADWTRERPQHLSGAQQRAKAAARQAS
jgi:hypothetical protein